VDSVLSSTIEQMRKKKTAEAQGASLLFGEVLPTGVAKMCDDNHLRASKAKIVYDLGAGPGKMALQILFQYPNVDKIVAVELCESRYRSGAAAMRRIAKELPDLFQLKENSETSLQLTTETKDASGIRKRVLEFHEENLFKFKDAAAEADLVVLETDFPKDTEKDLVLLLAGLKSGARCLLYKSVLTLPGVSQSKEVRDGKKIGLLSNPKTGESKTLAQWIEIAPGDTYQTSWNQENGHPFDTWAKL